MIRAPSLLFLNVLVVSTCGLVYELLAGTLASHVLGDSVTQFSVIIGLYLSAMGVGAWLSGFIEKNLATRFIDVELAVALLGGLSAPMLLLAFARLSFFPVVLYGLVFVIGTLVGLELPLLLRICKDELDFKDLIARVLSFDYLGALFASLLFPLVFVPHLGLLRTSVFFGLCNAAVALWGTSLLRDLIGPVVSRLRARGVFVIAILSLTFIYGDRIAELAEDDLFPEPVVHAQTTPYQRIVITQGQRGFALFLNGNLQFHEADEYRYHEALVHPAMASASSPPRRVLILGGGDGLALREVLRWPSVEAVTLVDLDPAMPALARSFVPLAELCKRSFDDPRVTVVSMDAYIYLEAPPPELFDVAIVDFPDPNNFALGKLYTRHFYLRLSRALGPLGAIAVQSTSPLFAPRSFWTIVETMQAAGWSTLPYHVTVPSFGVWGYVLARRSPFEPPQSVPDGLRYLTDETLPGHFAFSADMSKEKVLREGGPLLVNRLDNQVLVTTYEAEWRRWN